MLTSMVNVLGRLPERWKGYYNGSTRDDSWYDQSGKPDPTMLLKAMIKRARPEASETEQNNLLSVMSKGFCYLPESRMSAEQLLQDTSFRTIQLMHELASSVAESAFGACASHQQNEYRYPSISISLPDPTLVQLLSGPLFSSDCTLSFCPDLHLDHYLNVKHLVKKGRSPKQAYYSTILPNHFQNGSSRARGFIPRHSMTHPPRCCSLAEL